MPHELFRLLRRLDELHLHYRLDRCRDESVMVTVTLVGERIEIDVFEDGHIEYSSFKGDEAVESGDESVAALYRHLATEAE
jgi:hypothetical protein